MFFEITKRDGFDIHIRTKGTFNRHVCELNKFGNIRFHKNAVAVLPIFPGATRLLPLTRRFWLLLQKTNLSRYGTGT